MKRNGLLLLIAVMGMSAAMSGCSSNPATGERQLSLISREQEIAMGEEAAPQFKEEFGGEVPSRRLQEYVTSIGMGIARRSDRPDLPWEFAVVQEDTPNAFALPGGKIFITDGLMQIMESERELAAVLAHEIAHVNAKHNVQAIQRQMGTSLLIQVAGAVVGADYEAVAEAAGKVVGAMANLSYSRDAEYQADEYGIEYMQRAGHNPWGMVDLLTTLQEASGHQGGRLSEMFQTHPLTENRIEHARTILEDREDYGRYRMQPPPADGRYQRMKSLL